MNEFGNQRPFTIKPVIEQQPFNDLATQTFFTEWCRANDSIVPRFVDRAAWNQRTTLLQKRADGTRSLLVPTDLQLWEMVGVVEAVDRDTFTQKPDRQTATKEQLVKLGHMFRSAGVYIAQRIDHIAQGKPLAETLAEEFYSYGESLINGKKPDATISLDAVAAQPLTPEVTTTVDRWLAGNNLYASRRVRVEHLAATVPEQSTDELIEIQRRSTLAQFFRAADLSLRLLNRSSADPPTALTHQFIAWIQKKIDASSRQKEKRKQQVEEVRTKKIRAWKEYQKFLGRTSLTLEETEEKARLESILFTLKPWVDKRTVHKAFIDQVEEQAIRAVETPKRELGSAIFRRGMELLQSQLGFGSLGKELVTLSDKIIIPPRRHALVLPGLSFEEGSRYRTLCNFYENIISWSRGETTLRQGLKIDSLKRELDRVRKHGNVRRIGQKEREIAVKIQKAVGAYRYSSLESTPTEIVKNEHMNCVGASMLGGALLSEVGIQYLVGHIPEHAIVLLITSDGSVIWQDMMNPSYYKELSDDVIQGTKTDGTPVSTATIVDFSKQPRPEGLIFDVTDRFYRGYLSWIPEGTRRYMTVFEPEIGHQVGVLGNLAGVFSNLGQIAQATSLHQQLALIISGHPNSYHTLGYALYNLEKYEEAVALYQQAIRTGTTEEYVCIALGRALSRLHRHDEAVEVYQKAIVTNPHQPEGRKALGDQFVKLEYYQEAVEEYQKALVQGSSDPLVYGSLGITLGRLGRKKEAILAYQCFIALSDKQRDEKQIELAEGIIAELQNS